MEPPLTPTPVPATNGVSTNGLNGVHSNGINGRHSPADANGEPTASSSAFDPAVFRSYVLALLPALLGALPEDLAYLFDEYFDERVTRFAAEGNGVIYVSKIKDEVEGAAGGCCAI
jgi:hypothetical protein